MTRRDILGRGRIEFTGPFESLSRYDLLLTVIPLAFLASLLATGLLSVPLREALGAGSAVGALAVADALFLHPPGKPE